ncbi:MAG TPA: permease-like cell division protein FtsX, partial [Mycobacteriales bacterium]|nr:permease-like cell division protein FtsX [Mycobacteriales bacterium]
MRFQFVVSELALGLRRNVTMTVAAMVTITISLTLLGGALMIRTGASRLEHDLLNEIEVSVYLQPNCGTPNAPANCLTLNDQTQIYKTLKQLPQVKSVQYVSQAEAYQHFKDEFANDPDLTKEAGPNTLPASFAVGLKDPHQFAVINSAVSQAPGVQSVTNASQDLKTLFAFFHRVTLGVLLIAVVLLAATCLLIYNTMLVAAFTRRRETGIMRLVGASDFYIQAPFILEGTVIGIIGSGFALA